MTGALARFTIWCDMFDRPVVETPKIALKRQKQYCNNHESRNKTINDTTIVVAFANKVYLVFFNLKSYIKFIVYRS